MTNPTIGLWTPGPWMAAASPSSVVGWPVVRQGVGRSICSVSYLPREADAEVYAESEANARLIAKAPELLKYLELALSVLDRANVVWGGEPAARAIIAKARGDQ